MGDLYEQSSIEDQKKAEMMRNHQKYMEENENVFKQDYETAYGDSSYVKTVHKKRLGKRKGLLSRAYAAVTKSAKQADIEKINVQRVNSYKGLHNGEDDNIFQNPSDVEQIKFFDELKDMCANLCDLSIATKDFIEAVSTVDDYITAENYDDQQKALNKALESLKSYADKCMESDNEYDMVLASKADVLHRMILGRTNGTLVIPAEYQEQACKVQKNPAAGLAGTYSDVSKLKLFPHEPSPNDVKQRTTSDCYMMSALCSIASSQPDFIKRSMVDNGDTVTVRFFEPLKEGETQAKPVFITVTKEIPTYLWVAQKNAVDSLWVQMIEKAFAVYYGNEHIRDKRKKEGPDDGSRSYAALDYQDSFAFMSRFLGSEYKNPHISAPGILEKNKYLTEERIAGFETEDKYKQVKKIVNKPMSDIYSGVATRLHDQWKLRIDNREIITVGVNYNIKAAKAKGIHAKHAYSVLKVYDVQVGDKIRRFVRLRDPYGAYTADYDEKSKKTKSTGNSVLMLDSTQTMGTFDMEWNDFLETFDTYCGCIAANSVSTLPQGAIAEADRLEQEEAERRREEDAKDPNGGFELLDEDEFK